MREPEVIAIPVQESAFGAVDIGRRSPMHWQRGVLFGVRLLDVRSARHFPGNRLADGEQLPGEARRPSFPTRPFARRSGG